MSGGVEAKPQALEHFADYEEQHAAATLGMWVFLTNELLLFAGLFMTAIVLRILHPDAVLAAGEHLKWWLAGFNTAVLMTSAFTMTVAIEAARRRDVAPLRRMLLVTAVLGAFFLVLKGVEYLLEYEEHLMPFLDRPFALPDPASRLFLNLYFIATGLHALHILIGLGLLLVAWRRSADPAFVATKTVHIEIAGLYWHFVDLVWIFLFTTLYLVNR
ncbi:cytochrome c oxidase subunit 3 [Marinivivus vitaminiproducens]|uniref:cytochrome c oxidase subunit 3 n=1 Tax=Marinivivus vitaminiproducens TaxID=3035935 RepID=UPI0027A916FA|nr:cytochrome c oxidase subunit 3 [Geminicoccaceae bacterium SCSIO 64248]